MTILLLRRYVLNLPFGDGKEYSYCVRVYVTLYKIDRLPRV